MSAPDTTSPDLESDLSCFALGDESEARRAFDRLTPAARRYLRGCLRGHAGDVDECEDLVQETLTAVWRYRARFECLGPAAWLGLLRRTARQRLIDRRRGRSEPTLAENWEELPDALSPGTDALAAVLLQAEAERLERAADVLWLGLDPTQPRREHRRRLLAAQSFYLDGARWDQIARVLGLAPPEAARRALDGWLADPGVLRHLAHSQLYVPGPELARRLLEGSCCPEAEARVIRWRYEHGLLVEGILARRDCPLDREALEALVVRTRARLPFMQIMTELLATLDGAGPAGRGALAEPGLWRRLAFDYAYREGLPHRDILERLEPAAEQVGFRLTPAALNGWLSGGRLLRQLAGALGRIDP